MLLYCKWLSPHNFTSPVLHSHMSLWPQNPKAVPHVHSHSKIETLIFLTSIAKFFLSLWPQNPTLTSLCRIFCMPISSVADFFPWLHISVNPATANNPQPLKASKLKLLEDFYSVVQKFIQTIQEEELGNNTMHQIGKIKKDMENSLTRIKVPKCQKNQGKETKV